MDIAKLKNKLWIWFWGVILLLPVVSFFLKVFTLGEDHFRSFFYSLIIGPFLIIAIAYYFHYHVRKLVEGLDLALHHKLNSKNREYWISKVNSFPIKTSLGIGFYNFVIPTFIETVNFVQGIVFSWQQVLFFWIIDFALSAIAASAFFYQSKQIIYPVINFMPYKPIRLFHKILIPVMIMIQSMVMITSIGVYHIGVIKHEDFMRQIMSLNLEEASLYLNTTLEKLIIQTDSYTKNETIRTMNQGPILDYLKDLHSEKESFVKTFFVSNMEGETINSLGFRFNVKNGKVFQKILKTQKFAISNPVKSLDDGSWVLVSAVPIKWKNQLIGNFGMTFAIETLGEALNLASDHGKYDFIMFSEEGKIVYQKNYNYLSKDFSKDFNDPEQFTGFENLVSTDLKGIDKFNRKFIELKFEGRKTYGMLIEMPKFNSRLLMFIPKNVFYAKLNVTLLQISGFIVIATLSLMLVVRGISNNLAIPIQNTIIAFEKISNGDLTSESRDIVPDEFGEIIRYLNNLISILRNTVSLIKQSSDDLALTSEKLTRTTVQMANNSQEQASSLLASEEFVKNMSDSVEMVSDNSKKTFLSSKETYNAMEELLKNVKEVKENTNIAHNVASKTSQEAIKGNDLMKNTIVGMERIDSSTKKIAEIVGLIGDISRQVNLLALNAAIEAARAGEYGKGFTVVAEEIGKLADKTSRSAKSIKDYIQEGIFEVSRGKDYVDKTGLALSNIIQNIEKNTELINKIMISANLQAEFSEKVLTAVGKVMLMSESISKSTEEQTSANQELSSSVSNISELTRFLAQGAEEIAQTSLQISDQSKTLNQMIEFFKI